MLPKCGGFWIAIMVNCLFSVYAISGGCSTRESYSTRNCIWI